MDKEDVLFKYNGILVIIKTETMPLAATWMDLEIIILSKVSHTEKNKCHITSLMWASLVVSSKEFACHAGDVRNTDLIPGLGRSPGRRHGNPWQSSILA